MRNVPVAAVVLAVLATASLAHATNVSGPSTSPPVGVAVADSGSDAGGQQSQSGGRTFTFTGVSVPAYTAYYYTPFPGNVRLFMDGSWSGGGETLTYGGLVAGNVAQWTGTAYNCWYYWSGGYAYSTCGTLNTRMLLTTTTTGGVPLALTTASTIPGLSAAGAVLRVTSDFRANVAFEIWDGGAWRPASPWFSESYGNHRAFPPVGAYDSVATNFDGGWYTVGPLVVNTTTDTDDGTCNDAHCSLREAINLSNAQSGTDSIGFNIGGGGLQTIALGAGLPNVNQTVVIDGTTQPGYAGTPLVTVDGTAVGGGFGFFLSGGAAGSTIRGLAVGGFGFGMLLNANSCHVELNHVGLRANGTPLANSTGILVAGSNSTIDANVVSNNNLGIVVDNSSSWVGNAILENSISNNNGLGIDLGNNNVVNPNDPGDGDTGPNTLQNFPVLTLAVRGTGVGGTLNSTALKPFRIEFFSNAACDGSGYGEGATYLGFTNVSTDGSGNASFTVSLPVVAVGSYITATATTDPTNNTSEFSACRQVTRADTTTTIGTVVPSPSVTGQGVAVSYTVGVVAPGAGTPTGNVTVGDGVDSCTGTVAAGSCTLTLTTAGARTLTATYAGDGDFNGSVSAGVAHTVNKASTTTTLTSSRNPANTTDTITFTATAAAVAPGSGTPGGTVTFMEGAMVLSGPTALVGGQATYATGMAAGDHTITVEYSGDANYLPGTSAPLTQTVIGASVVFPGNVVISEFRLHGPLGSNDEYVEIQNVLEAPLTVGADGWAVTYSGPSSGTVAVIPAGTVIPALGAYLLTNTTAVTGFTSSAASSYPAATIGSPVGAGDQGFTVDLPDDGGLALFKHGTVLDGTTRLDSVGFAGIGDPLHKEGAGLLPAAGLSDPGEYTFYRNLASGAPKDTGDNQADFEFVSVDAGTYTGRVSALGAPGPERTSSPLRKSTRSSIFFSLLDPSKPENQSPNMVRNADPYDAGGGLTFPLGTVSLQRRITNMTKNPAPITRLRFRVMAATTKNSTQIFFPTQADVRGLTSDGVVRATGGAVVVTVHGLTLEQPPAQTGLGGGQNSSFAVDLTGLPGGGLAPFASVDVQFLLGVVSGGKYRYLVIVETLP